MANSMLRTAVAFGVVVLASSAAAAMPILEFAFDEGNGTTAVNSGSLGAGSNGTLNGAGYSSETPFGAGFSLSLDGDTSYVAIPDTFDYGQTLTLEAWIRPDAVDGQRAIYDDYGNPGVFFAISNGVLQFNLSTGSHPALGIAVFAGEVCPGLWQHVAGTYDGAALRGYVNGVEIGMVESSGSISDNGSSPAHIGADSGSPSFLEFSGLLDDLRVWEEPLVPEELGLGASLLLCGELTGDCAITAGDALIALRMAVGLGVEDPAADMNHNGSVTASDALDILRIGVGSKAHTSGCNS